MKLMHSLASGSLPPLLILLSSMPKADAQMFGMTKLGGFKSSKIDVFSSNYSKTAVAATSTPGNVPDNVSGSANASVELNLTNGTILSTAQSSSTTAFLRSTGFTTDGSNILAPAKLETSVAVKAVKNADPSNPATTGVVEAVPLKEVVYKSEVFVELTRAARSSSPQFVESFSRALR